MDTVSHDTEQAPAPLAERHEGPPAPPSASPSAPTGLARAALRPASRPGMTLVEIMIVLTIMAGIMAFAAYSVVGYLQSSKVKDAEAEVNQIRGFIDTFRVMHNRLPESLEELERQIDGLGQITDTVPNDPWDNPYEYSKRNDGTYVLFSVGVDGQSGSDDDIYPQGMGRGRR
jgi:general secretion pathway protein G